METFTAKLDNTTDSLQVPSFSHFQSSPTTTLHYSAVISFSLILPPAVTLDVCSTDLMLNLLSWFVSPDMGPESLAGTMCVGYLLLCHAL
jgi:hypothetical protein